MSKHVLLDYLRLTNYLIWHHFDYTIDEKSRRNKRNKRYVC